MDQTYLCVYPCVRDHAIVSKSVSKTSPYRIIIIYMKNELSFVPHRERSQSNKNAIDLYVHTVNSLISVSSRTVSERP